MFLVAVPSKRCDLELVVRPPTLEADEDEDNKVIAVEPVPGGYM